MTDKIEKCPKCGYSDIYIGATKIECGYVESCENYTKEQEKEVQKSLKENFPSIDDGDWDEVTPQYYNPSLFRVR